MLRGLLCSSSATSGAVAVVSTWSPVTITATYLGIAGHEEDLDDFSPAGPPFTPSRRDPYVCVTLVPPPAVKAHRDRWA
jgi:hypothetical protein